MGYNIYKLQNASEWDDTTSPTIIIKDDNVEWGAAYKNWQIGKMPTDSKEWLKGVFAITKQE